MTVTTPQNLLKRSIVATFKMRFVLLDFAVEVEEWMLRCMLLHCMLRSVEEIIMSGGGWNVGCGEKGGRERR